MIETLKLRIEGDAPLLMHNGRLANPMDPYAKRMKELTKARNKTDAQLLEIRRVEWEAGLYLDADGDVCLPADVVLACIYGGARKAKAGKEASAGVWEGAPTFKLLHDGPRDLDALYEAPGFVDYRVVVVSQRRTMRARPRFPRWSLELLLNVNADIINPEQVRQAAEAAGLLVGLGDWRPRFGRFHVV